MLTCKGISHQDSALLESSVENVPRQVIWRSKELLGHDCLGEGGQVQILPSLQLPPFRGQLSRVSKTSICQKLIARKQSIRDRIWINGPIR